MCNAVIFHVFIDQEPIGSFDATSSKADQIFMFDVRESRDLRDELPLASHRLELNREHFYRHSGAILKPALYFSPILINIAILPTIK